MQGNNSRCGEPMAGQKIFLYTCSWTSF